MKKLSHLLRLNQSLLIQSSLSQLDLDYFTNITLELIIFITEKQRYLILIRTSLLFVRQLLQYYSLQSSTGPLYNFTCEP